MKLEVLKRLPHEDSKENPPLLFVHGAGVTASYWKKFLPYMAEAGFPAYAVNLRGRGKSEGSYRTATLGKYKQDVRQAYQETFEQHDKSPVLIGHSFGGRLIQDIVATDAELREGPKKVENVVLMNTVPPKRFLFTFIELLKTKPQMLLAATFPQLWSEALKRKAFYTSDTPAEVVCDTEATGESPLMFIETMVQKTPTPIYYPRMLILGAERDSLVRPQEDKVTRDFWPKADYKSFENRGHIMMMEPGWEEIAQYLVNWLNAVR